MSAHRVAEPIHAAITFISVGNSADGVAWIAGSSLHGAALMPGPRRWDGIDRRHIAFMRYWRQDNAAM